MSYYGCLHSHPTPQGPLGNGSQLKGSTKYYKDFFFSSRCAEWIQPYAVQEGQALLTLNPSHTTRLFFPPPRQAQSGLLPLCWDYKGPLYWTLKGKRLGEGTHRARVTQRNSQGVEMMTWTESLTAFPLDYARGRPWPQSGT